MRWLRYLPFLVTGVSAVVLALAMWGPGRRGVVTPGPELSIPAPPANDQPDPAAMEVLEQVLARLQPPRVEWLQTGVWLRVLLPRIACEAEGTYVLAPGDRFRLDLQTSHPDRAGLPVAAGNVVCVCTGQDLWLASRTGQESWGKVSRLRVGAILEDPDSPAKVPGIRDHFLKMMVLRGLMPLLRTLQSELCWVRRESSAGEEVLTGTWNPALANLLPGVSEGMPKVCRLRLRGPDLWPGRFEWYGAADARGRMPLLAEVEFRDPVINQRLPEREAQRLFSFDPGDAVVTDLTPRAMADLETVAHQIRQQLSPTAAPARRNR